MIENTSNPLYDILNGPDWLKYEFIGNLCDEIPQLNDKSKIKTVDRRCWEIIIDSKDLINIMSTAPKIKRVKIVKTSQRHDLPALPILNPYLRKVEFTNKFDNISDIRESLTYRTKMMHLKPHFLNRCGHMMGLFVAYDGESDTLFVKKDKL